jgi:hypothetical protein
MVNEKQLLEIKSWFDAFTRGFFTGIDKDDSALSVKVRHTKNVAIEILGLADSLDMDAGTCYLAELCAVLHDVGRFEQYARYRVYSDARTEDHAALGVRALDTAGILDTLDPPDRSLIRFAVLHHNKASVPDGSDKRWLLFLKLLRDADKIDILRVVTDHYHGIVTDDSIDIGLPDTPEVSPEILANVAGGRIARVEDMKTLNDFKLLQIGWVFDINFPKSFDCICKRRYVQKLGAVLPRTDEVREAVAAALRHVERHCIGERSVCECQIP